MKTICTLDGRIIMSQDGEALEAMQKNASQYAGAVASVVTDADYDALILAQPKTSEELAVEAERAAQQQLRAAAKALALFDTLKGASLAQIDAWVDAQFPDMTAQQRMLLKLLTASAGLSLRER